MRPGFRVSVRDEAIETVGQVCCRHHLKLGARARSIDTTLDITGSSRQPVVRLRYGAPVSVDAGHFPDLFLIMRCTGGQGSVRQGRWVKISAGANGHSDDGTGERQPHVLHRNFADVQWCMELPAPPFMHQEPLVS